MTGGTGPADEAFVTRFCNALAHPRSKGARPPQPSSRVEHGVLIETDVAIGLRDGVRIRADIYRPASGSMLAAPLIAWGPYGKHGHTRYSVNFPKADVDDRHLSAYTAFEAPDPFLWVPHGYAVINVDPRGTWYSQGDASYLSAAEARDFYDVIEWAGTRDWSNGKVGLSGVSYLTSSQWFVAALRPPHLAAINPWEGWSDTYREVVRHGGIPETSFWDYLPGRWGHGLGQVEDLRLETRERPLFDAYWASKKADLEAIEVPAFVVASWTDQALHTRGTLEGFKQIGSTRKWLYAHGRKKWAHYYDPASIALQRQFFDRFLHDRDSGIEDWPKVRLEVRERFGVGKDKSAAAWPVPETRYRKYFLRPDGGLAETSAAAGSVRYDARAGAACFAMTFAERTELVGHMKLLLHVEADGSDDMDLFVAVQKLDRDGALTPFAFYAQYEDGPVALGWLRVSHRGLDAERSREWQPVHLHDREDRLAAGEIVPVDIEIWPSGTGFDAGEGLRVVVQGRDVYDYPKPSVYARHEDTRNRGVHILHMGGEHDSHLLVPEVTL